jgi:Protein of unknown function (DUF835)
MPQAYENATTGLDPPIQLNEGSCYLVRGKPFETTYRLFQFLVEHGHAGLCVSRIYPDRVRERYGVVESPVWWISHSPGDGHIAPTSIGTLAAQIEGFIAKQTDRSVILLDGLEFISANIGFDKALFFLEHLTEHVMPRNAIVLIPVDPACFDATEFARLERFRGSLEEIDVRRALETDEVAGNLLLQ